MKPNIDSIIKEYDYRQDKYEKLGKQAKYLLRTQIGVHKTKIHEIKYRIKKIDSLLSKIRDKNIVNPFKNVHDIVGVRVVCLFLSDLNVIRDIVRKNYVVVKEDNIIDDSKPSIFGYLAIQMDVKLKHSSRNKSNKSIENIIFEIQIRTIAQDAWASISHYIDYKKKRDVPKKLKRELYALSGLFYIADTHFSSIREKQMSQAIEKSSK